MKRTIASGLAAAMAAAGLALVGSPAGAEPAHSEPPSEQAAAQAADAHLAGHPNAVHSSSNGKLVRTGVQNGTKGLRYVHYKRVYQGVPVVGGDVVVMTDADGDVLSTSVAQKETIDISVEPNVSAGRAKAASKKRVDAVESLSEPRLVVLTWEDGPQLAWETVVHGTSGELPTKLHVFVDARTGDVVGSYDEVKAGSGEGYYVGDVTIETSRSGSGYAMDDPTRQGIQCGGQDGGPFTGQDDRWGNGSGTSLETACVDALYAVQTEWDMLGDWLGRNGIDGNGGGFAARVGLDAVNAYWNGRYANFGHSADGQRQATSMDVVGHEFGHAIFQFTPGGAGYGVDNGLNEATGDIFGALTEAYADNSSDPADYKVGEEVDLGGSGPIRYMYNPSLVNHPNCYSSRVPDMEVHKAAGPLNHWFYLLAEGSNPAGDNPNSPTCDNSTVDGIGLEKAGQIYYNAMLQKTSTWSYLDVRVNTLTAAKNLFEGCTVFNKVKAAWQAVSISEQPGEPSCGGGDDEPPNDDPPQSGCAGHEQVLTGSLNSGDVAYEPDGSYFYAPAGTHTACLDGPDGTDFDLYLQKWNGGNWVDVASGTTPGPDETLTHTGSAGYYSYQIHAYSGSGNYTLGFDTP